MQGKKIVILGTGGTIAGTAASASDNNGYTAAQQGVEQLLRALPDLSGQPFDLVCEQVAQIDSKDMTLALWQQLLLRCRHWLAQTEVQGIVITHGTDTLEETAYWLQAVLAPAKPLVLTCAMRPATSISADGPQNLLDALRVAAHPGARGVSVVCAGIIHSAFDVQKVHSWRLDAFSSGDAGAVGQVVQGRLHLNRPWPDAPASVECKVMERMMAATDWPRVEIVLSYAAASGAMVDALVAPDVAARFGAPPVRGLVVAGTGNGTLHQELAAALQRAEAAGIRVVRSTRCVNGGVSPTPHDVFPDAHDLTPVKARVALMLALLAEDGGAPS